MTACNAHTGPEGSLLRGGVAIIGMACIFPGAPDLEMYWQNIISKVDAITDPPPDAWDPKVFYDPDSTANDRVYCKRGGYLGDAARFNPLDYGIMPVTVDGGSQTNGWRSRWRTRRWQTRATWSDPRNAAEPKWSWGRAHTSTAAI